MTYFIYLVYSGGIEAIPMLLPGQAAMPADMPAAAIPIMSILPAAPFLIHIGLA